MKIRDRYKLNKESKVGSNLICPSCNTTFIKTNYQQCFCKSKPKTQCKDKYWNTVDHSKRNNTTRISPASARWLDNEAQRSGYPDNETRKNSVDDFDGSWEAHSCHVENCQWCGMKPEYCECLSDSELNNNWD